MRLPEAEERFTMISALEKMVEVAALRVPAKDILGIPELRAKYAEIRQALLNSISVEPQEDNDADTSPEQEAGTILRGMMAPVEALLKELEKTINDYTPSADENPSVSETKILQLCGVAETAISQFWFLDCAVLSDQERAEIDQYPTKLQEQIEKFQERHDAPFLDKITMLAQAPTSIPHDTTAPLQTKIAAYTNAVDQIGLKARSLRGSRAQIEAQRHKGKMRRQPLLRRVMIQPTNTNSSHGGEVQKDNRKELP